MDPTAVQCGTAILKFARRGSFLDFWISRLCLLSEIRSEIDATASPTIRISVYLTTICQFDKLYIVEVAQTDSRRLPTAAARIRAQVRSCGVCGG
jgi:hypothetical protein